MLHFYNSIRLQKREFSIFHSFMKNHYKALGVSKDATQSDIKSAYYKLSMVYHPDKNKDSEDAVVKFRDITAAYEVLGNYKLRKLYDKGLKLEGEHFPDKYPNSNFQNVERTEKKIHMHSGRTTVYNFDEWSKVHYGTAFERRQSAKIRYEDAVNKKESWSDKKGNVVLTVAIIFLTFLIMSTTFQNNLDDTYSIKSSKHQSTVEPFFK